MNAPAPRYTNEQLIAQQVLILAEIETPAQIARSLRTWGVPMTSKEVLRLIALAKAANTLAGAR